MFVNIRYTAPRRGTRAFSSGHLSTPPAGRQILSFVVQLLGCSPEIFISPIYKYPDYFTFDVS
jgi:hypothetical protein